MQRYKAILQNSILVDLLRQQKESGPKLVWTYLVVQWLRLHTANAGGLISIPGQGTRSHMPQLKDSACLSENRRFCVLQLRPSAAKKKKKKKKKKKSCFQGQELLWSKYSNTWRYEGHIFIFHSTINTKWKKFFCLEYLSQNKDQDYQMEQLILCVFKVH